MGCRRSVPSVPIPHTALLVVLVFSILLITSPCVTALAQQRTPVRGGSLSVARDQQDGLAEAAAMVAERLTAAFAPVEGLIIGVEDGRILIDRGTAGGMFQGMELDVFREGKDFKHPLTGEILGRLDKELGVVRILRVHEHYAEATVVKTSPEVELRQGDRVRVSKARMIVALPNIDVEAIAISCSRQRAGCSARTRSMTRELAAALVRTGRFELIEDRQLRLMLSVEKNFMAGELTAPLMLKQLADRGKVQVLLLSRLTPMADSVSLDVQAYSTLTGNSIVLASARMTSDSITQDQSSRRSPLTPATDKPTIAPPPASRRPPIASISSAYVVLEPVLDGSMTAMVVADLEGDGTSELLLAGDDRLLAFRIDGSHLRPLAEYPLQGKGTVVMLETIDVTGDRGAEITITLSHERRVHTLVLQLADGKFRPIWEIPDLVLRPLSFSGKTPQLFGQMVAPVDQSAKPIRQYTWDGQNFHPGPVLDISAKRSLLEFMIADLGGDGVVRMAPVTGGITLEVRSHTGDLIAHYSVRGETLGLEKRVGPRILVEKGRSGGRPQIILGREQETGSELLRWWTGSTTESLTVLKWDGAQLHEEREVLISDGVLADYAVADLGEGLGRRLIALVVKSGRLGLGKKSEIRAFRLP